MSDESEKSNQTAGEPAAQGKDDAAKKIEAKKAAAEKKAKAKVADTSERARGQRGKDLEAAAEKQAFQEARAATQQEKAKTALKGGDKHTLEEPLTGDEKAKAAPKPAKKPKVEYQPPPVEVVQRRLFMKMFGWTGLGAYFAFLGALAARFFWPRTLLEPPTSFVAGYPGEFVVGEVNLTFQNAYRVWIVRETAGIYALKAVCTHLGCTPVWIDSKNKFKCPCHGSGFTREGVNFEGPAPRPLERAFISLQPDGRMFVNTARVFRKERNEWSKAGAYVSVAA